MSKPLVIGVISQKGGVGKTTLAINLSVALRLMDYKVLLVDGDTSNPSIGLALGMEEASTGYKELLSKKIKLATLTSIHGATGLHVILGTLNTKPFIPTNAQLARAEKQLHDSSYDFVIVDTAPGYYPDATYKYWDEGLIVATPDLPAVTSVMRLGEVFDKSKVKCSLVLNMVKSRNYELRSDEIKDAWGGKVVGVLPEDEAVNEAIAERIPAYLKNRNSRFARAVRVLATKYTGRKKGISKLFTFR